MTTVASGLAEQSSPAAFVPGPTGVGLGADTASSTITAILGALTRSTSAGPGQAFTSGGVLSQPLGLAIALGGTSSPSTAATARSSRQPPPAGMPAPGSSTPPASPTARSWPASGHASWGGAGRGWSTG